MNHSDYAKIGFQNLYQNFETPFYKFKFIYSIIFTAVLLYKTGIAMAIRTIPIKAGEA
ncbi:hypothetical protein D3C75_1313880 [compost metagenome]